MHRYLYTALTAGALLIPQAPALAYLFPCPAGTDTSSVNCAPNEIITCTPEGVPYCFTQSAVNRAYGANAVPGQPSTGSSGNIFSRFAQAIIDGAKQAIKSLTTTPQPITRPLTQTTDNAIPTISLEDYMRMMMATARNVSLEGAGDPQRAAEIAQKNKPLPQDEEYVCTLEEDPEVETTDGKVACAKICPNNEEANLNACIMEVYDDNHWCGRSACNTNDPAYADLVEASCHNARIAAEQNCTQSCTVGSR